MLQKSVRLFRTLTESGKRLCPSSGPQIVRPSGPLLQVRTSPSGPLWKYRFRNVSVFISKRVGFTPLKSRSSETSRPRFFCAPTQSPTRSHGTVANSRNELCLRGSVPIRAETWRDATYRFDLATSARKSLVSGETSLVGLWDVNKTAVGSKGFRVITR